MAANPGVTVPIEVVTQQEANSFDLDVNVVSADDLGKVDLEVHVKLTEKLQEARKKKKQVVEEPVVVFDATSGKATAVNNPHDLENVEFPGKMRFTFKLTAEDEAFTATGEVKAILPNEMPAFVTSDSSLYKWVFDNRNRANRYKTDARFIMHGRTRALFQNFLDLLHQGGSASEREHYAELTPETLALRLSRCIRHGPPAELCNDEVTDLGFESWRKSLTADERALASLLVISAWTPLFNKGTDECLQKHAGLPYPFDAVLAVASPIQLQEGEQLDEYQHMLLTPSQNTTANGYGPSADASSRRTKMLRLWAKHYNQKQFLTFKEASSYNKYYQLKGGLIDTTIYCLRLRLVLEPFLLDVAARASEHDKRACVRIVGTGCESQEMDCKDKSELLLKTIHGIFKDSKALPDCIGRLQFVGLAEEFNKQYDLQGAEASFKSRDELPLGEPVLSEELLAVLLFGDVRHEDSSEYWSGRFESDVAKGMCCSALPLLANMDFNEKLKEEFAVKVRPEWKPLLPTVTTEAKVADVTLKLLPQEPARQRYLHIDSKNLAHVLLPVVGGEEVSTDNTCQSAMELQKFFGKAFRSAQKKDSAIHQLQRYLDFIRFDIWLAEKLRENQELIAAKMQRLEQVENYITVITALASDKNVCTALQGSYPKFPNAINTALAQTSNIRSMVLCPRHIDSYLRFPAPAFAMRRPRQASAFGRTLVEQLQQQVPASAAVNPLEAFVFAADGGLTYDAVPDDEKLGLLQTRMVEFFRMYGQERPPFHSKQLQHYEAAMLGETFDSMQDLYETVCSAEDIEVPQNVFKSTNDPETVNIMTQAFIAMAALHERAYSEGGANVERNLAAELDANDGACAIEVFQCLFKAEPETALLNYLASTFMMELSPEVRAHIVSRFNAMWSTVKDAPHFDEFMLLFSDLPGNGLSFHGCISIHLGAFLEAADAATGIDAEQWAAITAAKAAFQSIERPLPPANGIVAQEHLPINTTRLTEILTQAEVRRAAELLLSKNLDETGAKVPLYKTFIRDGTLSCRMQDWAAIRSQMLSLMPDDKALSEFSSFVGGVMVWFRITSYIARSLYKRASQEDNAQKLHRLNQLDNTVRPDKLQYALQLLNIHLDQDRIEMSEHYDGYTVHTTAEQMAQVMRVHEEQRRNFHLTMDVAGLLYKEVSRRFSPNSEQYREMQSYHNQTMLPVPDPRTPGSTIQVPKKIFKACVLLDIFIPTWRFNNCSGYFISADDPANIDALERTAEWSRQQEGIAGGVPANIGGPTAASLANMDDVHGRRFQGRRHMRGGYVRGGYP